MHQRRLVTLFVQRLDRASLNKKVLGIVLLASVRRLSSCVLKKREILVEGPCSPWLGALLLVTEAVGKAHVDPDSGRVGAKIHPVTLNLLA